jgi:hypothetical protein
VLRVSAPSGITHGGAWTYGEWVGRTACGLEFIAARNQWQRRTPEGLLRLQDGPMGGHRRGLILLETPVLVDCMSCLVRAARAS